MNTGTLRGKITHARRSPHRHVFTYDMAWHVVDLNAIEQWVSQGRFRKHNQWAWNSIHDRDYVDRSSSASIANKLQAYLAKQGLVGCDRLYLMTHPRFMGFGFNSVSFYFCYQGEEIKAIVSEINNTPWQEKHLYYHPIEDNSVNQWRFVFDKSFHISPFVEMGISYDWQFNLDQEGFGVAMKLSRSGEPIMSVLLNTEWNKPEADHQRPFFSGQALKMWLAIYWQAFRLWLKRTPVHEHPKTRSQKAKRVNNEQQ